MPDISMCKNENCESKTHCYRFTAKPSEFHQTYFIKDDKVDICSYYWKDEVAYEKVMTKTKIGKILYGKNLKLKNKTRKVK